MIAPADVQYNLPVTKEEEQPNTNVYQEAKICTRTALFYFFKNKKV